MLHKYSILLIGLPCLAELPSPVKELNRIEESLVGGSKFTEVPASSADFKTAAVVSVKTNTNGSKTSVDRSANATSAVYAGASLPNALPNPATPAVSSAPPES